MDATPDLILSAARPRTRTLSKTRVALVALLMAVPGFLWWIGVFGGNVREVVPGRFYRSAQLTGLNLKGALFENGIRSVINLRGPSSKKYYVSETTVCRDLGVAHYDVSLSAYNLPKPAEMRALIDDLDKAPRPVMVHCQGGSDRAGLASTFYEVAYEGVPLDRAETEQLTWRYGHFPLFGSWRMDRFFDLYRKTSQGQSLRSWTLRTYPAVYDREAAGR